jgi:hypothetical protein
MTTAVLRDMIINPFYDELNPICHLLALLGVHHILHVSRIRVKTSCHVSTQNVSLERRGWVGGVVYPET